ncbi:efflux RND transporter permease subunit [bacterium]|nr:efflux RND transporter permease subunit [bacterium]
MNRGLAGKIAYAFINSKLTPLLMAAFLAIGLYSAYLTPSEEEPQISVPIADVFVQYPGASPEEIESRVTKPLEKLISNIHGVEYVYSISNPGMAMLVVRYYVGEDVERSLVKLYNEFAKNMDKMPKGASMPLIKSKSIDDVPVIALTMWSKTYDDYQLRRVATELSSEIKQIEHVAETQVIGGRSRQIRVILDKSKMAVHHVDALMIAGQIQYANQQSAAGKFNSQDREFLVEAGSFLESAEEVGKIVIGVYNGSPVYLKNVAEIVDGPEESKDYVNFGFGDAAVPDEFKNDDKEFTAITLSVSKSKGSDAMKIAEKVISKVNALKGGLIPSDVIITTTRNYGETASEKVGELLKHLSVAILAVTVLVALAMGWRSGLVIFMTVPVTFALTLFVYYMFGYTLNRITLFALVFVTGLVVDDAIIVVENMHRHFKMKQLPFLQAAIAAIDEVGNPTILATFTVIAAVLPMAFVSGLMGPYMSPMPIGASLAMLFSLLIALVITPWLVLRLFKNEEHGHAEKHYQLEETKIYKWYAATVTPLIESKKKRWLFLGSTMVLLLASMSLMYFKLVAVKMLPFDNKNEIQVIIDMPEGTTLERTAAATKDIAAYIRTQPEVVNYQSYVGTSAPINFNGLVRHYDLRRGSNVADIQMNLLSKHDRDAQSHDIAKRIRPDIQSIALKYNANVKIAEVPPGPPVLSTMVAEIYGPDYQRQIDIAKQIRSIFETTESVVDVDWFVEDDQTEYKFEINKEKAMLSGVNSQQIVQALGIGLNGMNAATLYKPKEHEPVAIQLKLAEKERSSVRNLKDIQIHSMSGAMVPISELVTVTQKIQDKTIYRKNQQRVVYVTADVAGKLESPVYAIMDMEKRIADLKLPEGYAIDQLFTKQPFMEERISMKWDGEWHITFEVFRDLGAAFAVVLAIIYLLIIGWFQSFKVPLVMMVAIPLSLIGILIGHWVFGAFFTATSMIGMIALAGIMVRNSVLLIDFIDIRLAEGIPLKHAIIESGAVRTTPILLTSGAVVIGAFVILFDPIFQGLAISLVGGSIASTALTLVIVPLIYYMTERKKYELASASPEEPQQDNNKGNGKAVKTELTNH